MVLAIVGVLWGGVCGYHWLFEEARSLGRKDAMIEFDRCYETWVMCGNGCDSHKLVYVMTNQKYYLEKKSKSKSEKSDCRLECDVAHKKCHGPFFNPYQVRPE